uniref:Ig-like domain-containing protein n=1 Tax=Equus caballus TaxID=9796 RepID=A0A3Q2KZ60_HORSE
MCGRGQGHHRQSNYSLDLGEDHSCLEPAMGIRLLCVVAFCFPGLGFMDATVTQTERYLVKRRGDKVVMHCQQNMDHNSMFWYRQDPALGLQLLHFSYRIDDEQKGDAPEGYSVSRKKKENFTLILESASTNQTSVYLCASSFSTALH